MPIEASKCKLCGAAHWSWQPHKWPPLVADLPEVGVEPETIMPETMHVEDTMHTPIVHGIVHGIELPRGGRGKRIYADRAAQVRAYRARRKHD